MMMNLILTGMHDYVCGRDGENPSCESCSYGIRVRVLQHNFIECNEQISGEQLFKNCGIFVINIGQKMSL